MLGYSQSPLARNSSSAEKPPDRPPDALAPNPAYVFSAGDSAFMATVCLMLVLGGMLRRSSTMKASPLLQASFAPAREYAALYRKLECQLLDIQARGAHKASRSGADVDEHFASDDDQAQTSQRKKW